MDLLLLLLAAVGAISLDTVWVALFRARPIGKFRVVRDGSAIFQFESDAGSFSILPKEGKLTYKSALTSGTLSRTEIKGLEFRVRECVAVVQELFFGLDVSDMLAQCVDTVDWFSLAVVTNDGKRIPLFVSGQYTPREFLLTWYIDVQARFLEYIGVIKDVEAQSRMVMELVRTKLGEPRLL